MSITYCSRTDCIQESCFRHQKNAPLYGEISIADMNDNCYLSLSVDDAMLVESVKRSQEAARKNLLNAICYGTQNTAYHCDDICKTICGSDGTCAYCATIADAIEEAFHA